MAFRAIGSLAIIAVLAYGGVYLWGLVFSGPIPSGEPTAAPSGPGWIDLLDAEHRGGWTNITDDTDIFEIADDQLHIYGYSLYPLRYAGYTNQRFADFDLHLEFRLADGANSGVFLRAQADDPVYRGFEVQVLEDYGSPPSKTGSGGVYDVVTPMFNMARPAGEWNSYDISLRGGELVVFMNGWRVVHANLDQMTMPIGKFTVPFAELPRDGILAIQDHGGEAWYRNVRIRPAEASDPIPVP